MSRCRRCGKRRKIILAGYDCCQACHDKDMGQLFGWSGGK